MNIIEQLRSVGNLSVDKTPDVILRRQIAEMKHLVPGMYLASLACAAMVSALFFDRAPITAVAAVAVFLLIGAVRAVAWFWTKKSDVANVDLRRAERLSTGATAVIVFVINAAVFAFDIHATPEEKSVLVLFSGFVAIGGALAIAPRKVASRLLLLGAAAPYALWATSSGDGLARIISLIVLLSLPVAWRNYGRFADMLTELMLERTAIERRSVHARNEMRAFLQLASDWPWETDADDRITYFPESFARFLGIRASDAIGVKLIDAVHASFSEGYDAEKARFVAAIKARASIRSITYAARSRHGEERVLQTTMTPAYDVDGVYIGLRGWTTDISESFQNRTALEESERRYQDFAEIASDWTWEADAALRYSYFSEKATELTGLDHDRFIGSIMGDSLGNVPDSVVADHRAALAARQPFRNVVSALADAHGKTIWVSRSGRPAFDRHGEFIGYRGVCRNVTAELEAKVALEESRNELQRANEALERIVEERTAELRNRSQLLAEVIESMADGLCVFDDEFRIVLSNEKAATMSGLDPAAWAPGRPIDDLLALGCRHGLYKYKSADAFFTEMSAALAQDGFFQAIRRQKDGRIVSENIMRRPSGGQVVTYTDLTELKNREARLESLAEELKAAKDAAELASRAKSEFLANMSHEIRTPMNGVIGMASLLVDSDLSLKQREMAQVIVNSGENLLTIINDILDFSKLEAGKVSIASRQFDLRDMIDDVCQLLSVRVQEKGVELMVRYAPGLGTGFIGDEARLRQVFTNLLGNAVKFTDEGQVLVCVAGRRRGEFADIELVVEDTGCGIPDEKLGSIFEAFEQVDNTASRRHDGTGLGLAISRRLVEAMGGKITATSAVGQGSAFKVRLSLRVNETAALEAPRKDGLISDARILVVDDNAVNREILYEQLSAWGMKPALFENAAAAFDELTAATLNRTPYDLAIVDHQMPGMDGVALAEKIRADSVLKLTPLVLLTSGGRKGKPDRDAERLFDAYLVKPARASMLLDAIATSMRGRAIDQAQVTHARLAAAVQAPKSCPFTVDGSPIRVLVAEDNIVNQMVIKSMLEKLFCNSTIVENGRLAVEKYKAAQFDIVLMDMSMPEMDGGEATRLIRDAERDTGRTTPIVGVTAHALAEDRARCLDAGMDDYLPKPVKQDALFDVLKRWTSKDDAARESA